MKQLIYNSALAFFALCLGLSTAYAYEAKREVIETYDIKPDTEISINNKYGNVIINRWDKNQVDLKVTIEASGKNDNKTQQILDAIRIDISDRISSGRLSFETQVGNISGNASFSIHYDITMPNTNPLDLRNSFGSVYMGSYEGELEVDVKYGQFQAEDLEMADISIEFSNSRCEIETLKAGSLDLRYSKLAIENMGDIEISSQFSELEIENAGVLDLDGRYGNFEIENLKGLKGDLQFAGLDVENLEESFKLESRHGDGIRLENVSNKFNEIDIDTQFSSVDMSLEPGTQATLEFDLQFGNLRAHGDGISFDKVIKENNYSEYEGYIGSKDASSSIKVATRHGNIRLEVN